MLAQLVSLGEGSNIVLDKPIVLIGRHPECDIQLDSRKISRRHCCIAQVSDYLVVRDLGSTNGVRINGARVVEGKLHDSDELIIGNQPYRVTWDGAKPPPEQIRHPNSKIKERVGAGDVEPVLDAIIVDPSEAPEPPANPGGAPKSRSTGHRSNRKRKPSSSAT